MTISTLLDSNVLIDVLGHGSFETSSKAAIIDAFEKGRIVVSAVVWAEIALRNVEEIELFDRIAWMKPIREDLPFAAAYPAGRAHRLYRERGGARERTLPDFLIGAHALVAGHRLLTRDASRYRAYFPDLHIIAPEVHP